MLRACSVKPSETHEKINIYIKITHEHFYNSKLKQNKKYFELNLWEAHHVKTLGDNKTDPLVSYTKKYTTRFGATSEEPLLGSPQIAFVLQKGERLVLPPPSELRTFRAAHWDCSWSACLRQNDSTLMPLTLMVPGETEWLTGDHSAGRPTCGGTRQWVTGGLSPKGENLESKTWLDPGYTRPLYFTFCQ